MKQLRNLTVVTGLVTALALLWPAMLLNAFNPQPDPPAFAMIGVDSSATVRLNVICADGPLPLDVPPGPCDVTMDFRDIAGNVLRTAAVSLTPGHGASLDLRGADLRMTSRRAEIVPRIRPAGRGFVLASVEVFDDTTGRTIAVAGPTEPKSL